MTGRCLALGCDEPVAGGKSFCDDDWQRLPLHLRNDLFEAVLNNKLRLVAKLTQVCVDNLAAQDGL